MAYCSMSEDEKYLYREFEMKEADKINLKIYKQMYDAVILMSLDYENQITSLPRDINVPDEIALLFDDEVIAVKEMLYKNGMLSLDNCNIIKIIEMKLSEMGNSKNKNFWTLDGLKQSKLWEECRENARVLLSSLPRLD